MVKIEQLKNILRYRLHDDENDAVVYFTLDLDKYELIISGETSASYKWVETPKTESFIDLMLRCDKGYLAMKLGYSRPKEFNLDETIEKTIENIKDNYEEEIEEEFFEEIKDIDVSTCEGFYNEIQKLIEDYDLYTYDLHECVYCVEEHPYWLKKSVEYFCEHIKPLLKEVQENG